MKQKIEDLKVLIKNDRRILAGGVFVIAAFLLFMMTSSQQRGQRPSYRQGQQASQAGQQVGTGTDAAYNDIIAAFQNDLEELQLESGRRATDVERIVSQMDKNEKQMQGVLESVIDELEHINNRLDTIQNAAPAPDGPIDGGDGTALPPQNELSDFGFDAPNIPLPPEPQKPRRVKVISPGDSVELELLTGVNAPVDGTPYPVVFRLASSVTGPDGSDLDIGEARIIAAAQGSEADSRVLFRLTNLAIRHKDGRRSVVPIDGWIVGEDGIRGMQGRLIDKLGRLIAATAGVTFAAALGESLENRNNVIRVDTDGENDGVTFNNDDINFATASAMVDASNRLGQILIDRYEKLIPVVEILSGRRVVAVFNSVAEVEDINEDEEGDEGIYAYSLD